VSIKDPVGGARQRQLLEKEGVRFGKSGSIDLETYGWGASPRAPRRRPPRK
jgi:methylated-DNA-protein-cysteine methyltransferase-like protein